MIKKSLIAFGIIILLIGITGGSVYMADRVFTPSTNEDKTIENTESSRKQEQTEIQNSTSPTITTKEQQTKNEKNKETEDTMKSSKTIALTFDDGPNPSTTPKLLEVLKQKDIHATFFVLGENVSQNEQLLKKEVQDGHQIGSHTFSHKDLAGLSDQEISAEITQTDNAILKAIGKKPAYVRPPYGSITKKGAGIINRPMIEWSVESKDWQSRQKEKILQQVKSTVYDGAIILLHDIYPETVDAVPVLIDELKREGYTFTTISDLLDNPSKAENYYGRNDHRPV
ncbi:TPA: polysaccharide deacetylase family protein [Enterococcus faecium]